MTDQTVEIAADELAELRAKAATPTRDLSPVKPQDHKKPAVKSLTGEYKGEKFTVSAEVFEDWEFLELSGEVDENPAKLPRLLKLTFGDDGYERLKVVARDDDGRLKTEAVMDAYKTIMEDAQAGN